MQKKKNGFENLLLVTQLGLNVLTPIFLCVLTGIFLDRAFGMKTLLIFLILGVLSGGWSAYRMAKHTIDREKRELDREKARKIEDWNEKYRSVPEKHDPTGDNKGGGQV